MDSGIARPDGTRAEERDYEAEVLALATAGSITNAEVREATGLDRSAVVRMFNRLVADGLLERHGSRRGTYYTPRRWQLSTGDISICLDRTAHERYEASIWVGNLSAAKIARDAESRMADAGMPEQIAQATALLEGLPTAAKQLTMRQAIDTPAGAWELDARNIHIELNRTADTEYRASVTASGAPATSISRSRSDSVYRGFDFRWPELAGFIKWLTQWVRSEEAPYNRHN